MAIEERINEAVQRDTKSIVPLWSDARKTARSMTKLATLWSSLTVWIIDGIKAGYVFITKYQLQFEFLIIHDVMNHGLELRSNDQPNYNETFNILLYH